MVCFWQFCLTWRYCFGGLPSIYLANVGALAQEGGTSIFDIPAVASRRAGRGLARASDVKETSARSGERLRKNVTHPA